MLIFTKKNLRLKLGGNKLRKTPQLAKRKLKSDSNYSVPSLKNYLSSSKQHVCDEIIAVHNFQLIWIKPLKLKALKSQKCHQLTFMT